MAMGGAGRDRPKSNPVTIPQIAVNTTAGTGAETSGAGFITNAKLKEKKGDCMLRAEIVQLGGEVIRGDIGMRKDD